LERVSSGERELECETVTAECQKEEEEARDWVEEDEVADEENEEEEDSWREI
jgi:hypothetical protein